MTDSVKLVSGSHQVCLALISAVLIVIDCTMQLTLRMCPYSTRLHKYNKWSYTNAQGHYGYRSGGRELYGIRSLASGFTNWHIL